MKRSRHERMKAANWVIPLCYAAVAIIIGMIFPRVEHHFFPGLVSTMSSSAAMAIASSVASGMIALTGIVFSLTFVMVQFSATAYSPRLVLWVARDPVMSHAMGVFGATFLYSLTFLAWVDRDSAGKVPMVSGWLVLVTLLGSMGMFIALVERIGLLQIGRMLIFTGDRGRSAIAELYGTVNPIARPPPAVTPRQLPLIQTIRHAGSPRVIQAIRVQDLVTLARELDVMIELAVAVGDTVVELSPLARIHGTHPPLDEARVRAGIAVGNERTFEQDPKYALRLVADIAIKALSAAINDPTTAVQALDQIEDLLVRLGRANLEIGEYKDAAGNLRLVVPMPDWEDFLRLGLDEILAYGSESVQVMRRLKALIKNLVSVLPPERHAALRNWEARLKGSIARSFEDIEEIRAASVPDRQGLGMGDEGPPAS